MTIHFTGGCACGTIRYEWSAEPVFAGNCHCRDCQRATGGTFAPLVFVPCSAGAITGDVKYRDIKGDSGQIVSRGFCPACGARLFLKAEMMPDLMGIMAGSLDDPSWFQPTMDIYTASAEPWDFMNPDLPKFPNMSPM
ncbi:MAG: GFA family protein [Gammaproteobacteria bacterium]